MDLKKSVIWGLAIGLFVGLFYFLVASVEPTLLASAAVSAVVGGFILVVVVAYIIFLRRGRLIHLPQLTASSIAFVSAIIIVSNISFYLITTVTHPTVAELIADKERSSYIQQGDEDALRRYEAGRQSSSSATLQLRSLLINTFFMLTFGAVICLTIVSILRALP